MEFDHARANLPEQKVRPCLHHSCQRNQGAAMAALKSFSTDGLFIGRTLKTENPKDSWTS
jgi:hypothetical protein